MLVLLLLTLPAGGCDLVGDLLEFGFWMIIILILLVVLLIWGGLRALRGGRRRPPRT
jgi:hypothetical protein